MMRWVIALRVGFILAGLLTVRNAVSQTPVTLELDTASGLLITAPSGYRQATYTFGTVPSGTLSNGKGITVVLSEGEGFVLYGPGIPTGSGVVHIQCSVWTSVGDVFLAVAGLNSPIDGSLAANMPANGAEFLGGWHVLDIFYDPKNDSVVPLVQAVSTGSLTTVVYIDRIVVTPLGVSSDGVKEAVISAQTTPQPTATRTPTPSPTSTQIIIDNPTPTATLTINPNSIFDLRKNIVYGNGEISGARYSLSGRYIAIYGSVGVIVWDVLQDRQLGLYDGHKFQVQTVAFTADDTRIISVGGYDDRQLIVWNLESGEQIKSIQPVRVKSLAVTSDSRYVIVPNIYSFPYVIEIDSGNIIYELNDANIGNSISTAITGDLSLIALGGEEGSILFWNAYTGQLRSIFRPHQSAVTSIDFSNDKTLAVSVSKDKTAKLWDTQTGKEIRSYSGHSDVINTVDFSPDGTRFITSSNDNSARIWSTTISRQIKSINLDDYDVLSAEYSPDGKNILLASRDASVKILDAETLETIKSFNGHTYSGGGSSGVSSVAFSKDDRQILTGGVDGKAILWETSTGKNIQEYGNHSALISSVAFSPDSETILTGSADRTARLWNRHTGEQLKTLSGHSDKITSVDFSPTGTTVATGSLDQSVRIWDVISGQMLKEIRTTPEPITSLVYLSDGIHLLTGSETGLLKLWNTDTGIEEFSFDKHWGSITSLDLSKDKKYVLTASADRIIKLIDLEQEIEVREFTLGHPITSACFAINDNFVFATSVQLYTKMWNINTGEMTGLSEKLSTSAYIFGGIYCAKVSHDDTKLLVGGHSDNSIARLIPIKQ